MKWLDHKERHALAIRLTEDDIAGGDSAAEQLFDVLLNGMKFKGYANIYSRELPAATRLKLGEEMAAGYGRANLSDAEVLEFIRDHIV